MAEVIVKVYRGKLIENIYRGDIAIVNNEGQTIYSIGNSDKITYWRSAAKPIQALAVIYSGAHKRYNLTEEEIAIMISSHNGEERHIKLVYSILKKINLTEENLHCGVCLPVHKPTAKSLKEKGVEITPVYNPCSGKHVAQLTLCQHYGWSIDDYYNIGHPVQKMILDIISAFTQYPKEQIYLGSEDCGVPVFGLPIYCMSNAYARLTNWEVLPRKYQESARGIFNSMVKHPGLIAGIDRFDTDLMALSDGNLVAKSGSDGVFSIGIRNKDYKTGMGITIKMESGNMKFLPMAVIRILEQLKIFPKEKIKKLNKYLPPDIKNFRHEKVGYFISDFYLNRHQRG